MSLINVAARRCAGGAFAVARKRWTPPPSSAAVGRRSVGAYENDGKTYVSMLNNNNIRDGIMISGYSQQGFRLNNNFMVLGPIVCFANSLLAWYIDDDRHVSEDSLSLLFHLEPRPSVVVLGVGDDTYRKQIDRVVLAAARAHHCNVVVLPVDAALATYNFIVSEGRHVAGAFIPPRHMPALDDDVITANARHLHLYGERMRREDVWVDDQEHEEKVNTNYREFAEVVGAQKAAEEELRRKVEAAKKPEKKIE